MTYPIYTETEKIFNEGNNREEVRININWFDAIDAGDDRRRVNEVLGGLTESGEDNSKRTEETISNVSL
jgi:hypothetical protein